MEELLLESLYSRNPPISLHLVNMHIVTGSSRGLRWWQSVHIAMLMPKEELEKQCNMMLQNSVYRPRSSTFSAIPRQERG
jgi:hypothetical protein